MRAMFLLVGGLALLLGGCTSKTNPAPPALHKEWLPGKWKNSSKAMFLAGCEFTEDGAVKMKFEGMEKPAEGRYKWSGERTIEVEYPTAADVQKAYKEAAKAYKDHVKKRIETKDLSDKAGPAMLGAVRDELPAKETFQVAISDQPRMLILTDEKNAKQEFDKED
jgi:hypothetical protein